MTILLHLVAIALVIAGIAGTVLPALPGTPLVFLGLLLAAKLSDFQRVGGTMLTVLAILTVVSFLADLAAVYWGARSVDASQHALLGAGVGMGVGIFLGLPGLVIGPFVGAFVGEWWHGRRVAQAGRVGAVAGLSVVLGSALRLALAFTMVGLFLIDYLRR